MEFEEYAKLYRDELLEDVIPFWLKHSPDRESGGFFTCLDEKGSVYDTDKFIWLQCRQVWMFSMLYDQVEKKKEWLDMALNGADFLLKHGRDEKGNWYFSLNRAGEPLVQPYNIFSDCFAAMAFGQLYKVVKKEVYRNVAVNTFHNILARKHHPKGKYDKSYPGTRPLQSFALPMILCNLVHEIAHVLEPEIIESTIEQGIHSVMEVFYRPELGLILENVTAEGEFCDSFEGRLVNPGHGLESMWFIMDLAEKSGNKPLIQRTVEISLAILTYGWDEKYEGLFYFLDCKGYPLQQLEWDQKLWWVHIEAMISVLKGYLHTGDERCWQWFEKLHVYTWKHFVDKESGEWYGYLNRQGEVLIPAKGGKWKGCFHVPRGLYQLWKTMEAVKEKYPKMTI